MEETSTPLITAPPRKSSSWKMALTVSFLVLIVLAALGILSVRGNTSSASSAYVPTSIIQNWTGADGGRREQWVEFISWEPRVFVHRNFLSKEECEYLIKLAEPHIHKSTVFDSTTGKMVDNRACSSSRTFLTRGRDHIVRGIEKRIADFTFIPVEHGEGLEVLRFEVGQKCGPHYDFFLDEFNTRNGGQRMATLLMYLSDVEEGGETVFPAAKGNISAGHRQDELSECGRRGLSIKPRMGDAFLFWSMKPDGTLDMSSLHGDCPVIKGSKWSSAKWLRVREYEV